MTPDETAAGLERCREQIDVLDRQIAALLNERAKVVEVIGRQADADEIKSSVP